MSTKDVQGVGIAMGANASVRIYGDVNYAPIRLSAPLREAFAPLLEDRTALFGGRQPVFDRIGEFVRGPGGFLVVTAPAGFGKTSLMASLVSGTPEAFAYHFFTSLYDADGLAEDFFLRNVVEQLAEWHGREGNLPEQRAELRALYHELLDEPLDTTLVLVLDGLDEVRGWPLRPYLARRLPERMHLVATVRDVGQDWRREYGFPPEQTTSLSLEGLNRDDVIEVLEAAGGSAAALAADPQALDQLIRVAAFPADPELGADPFYMRLLAEDAAERRVDATVLAARPAGLESYLDGWWQEIKRAAGDGPTRDLFGTLAAALGPISRADIEYLNPSLLDAWAADFFDDVLRRVRRLVVADEHGYSLVHPRLREYASTRINLAPYQERLVSLCRDWREHHSEYALSHGAYTLREAHDMEALVGLVSRDWMAARLSQTGSHAAFAEDVAIAHAGALQAEPPDVVQAMRLSHVHATLGSFATQVPPAALAMLVRLGRAPDALRQAAMIGHAKTRVTAYRMIAEAQLEEGHVVTARAALARGLAAAEAAHDERGQSLAELAPAYAAAGQFQQLAGRLDAFSLPAAAYRLAEATDAPAGCVGLQEIAGIAATIDDAERRIFLLALVCEGWVRLGDRERARSLLPDLKEVATRVAERGRGRFVLPTAARALARAGDRATAAEWAGRSREVLGTLSSVMDRRLIAERIAEAYAAAGDYEQAMDVACAALEDTRSADAVLAVVQVAAEAGEPELVLPRLKMAATLADAIDGEPWRASACCDLSVALAQAGAPGPARKLAGSIRDEGWHAAAHKRLATCLAEQQRFEEAQALADAVAHEENRAEAQRDLVRALARAGAGERAIELARQIAVPFRAAEAYTAAAEGALRAGDRDRAAELVDRAFDARLVLTQRADVVEALCAVARRLAEQDAHRADALIAAAVESAELDPRRWHSVQGLKTVGRTLAALGATARAEEIFQRASRQALTMTADHNRDTALAELLKARAEAGPLRTDEAFALADAIVDGDTRALSLCDVAVVLSARGEANAAALYGHALHGRQVKAFWVATGDKLRSTAATLAADGTLAGAELEHVRMALEAVGAAATPAAAAVAEVHEPDGDEFAGKDADAEEAKPADDDWEVLHRQRSELSQRVDQLAVQAWELLAKGDIDVAHAAACEAVKAARAIEIDDSIKYGSLEQAARMLANTGNLDGAIQVLDELPEWPRGAAFNRLAAAYLAAGDQGVAVGVWLHGFADLERATRSVVFSALETAPSLIEDDALLWQLCQAVLEVEHWWNPPASRVGGP